MRTLILSAALALAVPLLAVAGGIGGSNAMSLWTQTVADVAALESGGPPHLTASLNVSWTGANTALITADTIVVSDGSSQHALTGVSVTPSKAVAGPAANGRDQAGAFSNNTWVYPYVIWGEGQPAAGLWSASATTPTLPANYTSWQRAGPGCNTKTGIFPPFTQVGGSFRYQDSFAEVVSAGHATSYNNVDLSAWVPPATNLVRLSLQMAGASAGNQLSVRAGSANHWGMCSALVANTNVFNQVSTLGPVIDQYVQYKVSNASDNSYLYVEGFEW